jgi:hypothetical protein
MVKLVFGARLETKTQCVVTPDAVDVLPNRVWENQKIPCCYRQTHFLTSTRRASINTLLFNSGRRTTLRAGGVGSPRYLLGGIEQAHRFAASVA